MKAFVNGRLDSVHYELRLPTDVGPLLVGLGSGVLNLSDQTRKLFDHESFLRKMKNVVFGRRNPARKIADPKLRVGTVSGLFLVERDDEVVEMEGAFGSDGSDFHR